MHPLFSASHQSKIFSPAFSTVIIFHSSLMNMPIIYIEENETTLLTLFLGFIGGKVDSALNNTRFMTSPSEFTNFQILNFQLLQFSNLLEVVVIWRKKLPGQVPTVPNLNNVDVRPMWIGTLLHCAQRYINFLGGVGQALYTYYYISCFIKLTFSTTTLFLSVHIRKSGVFCPHSYMYIVNYSQKIPHPHILLYHKGFELWRKDSPKFSWPITVFDTLSTIWVEQYNRGNI